MLAGRGAAITVSWNRGEIEHPEDVLEPGGRLRVPRAGVLLEEERGGEQSCVSGHQMCSVRQLEEAIDNLQRQAEILRAEVRRFRV